MKSFLTVSATFLLALHRGNTVYANNDPILYGSTTAHLSNLDPSKYFGTLAEEDRSTYLMWLQESTYTKHTFLPMVTNPDNGAAVLWKVYADGNAATIARNNNNTDLTHIQVAVAVRATGWVGFGISEAGGMLGSDIALWETANPNTVRDSYVIEDFDVPKKDDCQHWTLLRTTTDNDWLIVEMSRPLDTSDPQDHKLVDDSQLLTPTRLIAAWGDSPTVSFHGFQVGKISANIFPLPASGETAGTQADFETLMDEQADGFFEILANNYTIPAQETTYHYICKSFEELQEQYNLPVTEDGILTFIAGGAVLSPKTEQYVHHFIVYGSSNPTPTEETCGQGNMLWGWAPGEEPTALPQNIGIPLFDPNGYFRSIAVEIHYNNPEMLDGLVDSSGFRVYFSIQPREIEAAWLALGDPATLMKGTAIEDGLSEYSFTCASDCSSAALGSQSVTVIGETLHMHKTGVRMTNELIRNGEVANLGAVDVFEFAQQGSFKVQQEGYEIMPGDSFKTTCYYRDGTEFGLSSQQEMCVAFLLYYPAKSIDFGSFGSFPWGCFYGVDFLPVCNEKLEFQSLASVEGLGRKFGTPPSQCTGKDAVAPSSHDNDATPADESVSDSAASIILVFVSFLTVVQMLLLTHYHS
ncbi:copper type II ascorbate-dependent monooxygenase [Nitzschia inconspicua]|uniref:Copper type II ascorbate-dependent monooxygenase n=1 Tax=Nitzschia inconspicua TaxID=303405 RepID=A0A9K3L3A0_9STRA|nr:copper type II ascorbate-dependent monooxygenase [Nitzschia inconspicua]